jgi:hypothetical protein
MTFITKVKVKLKKKIKEIGDPCLNSNGTFHINHVDCIPIFFMILTSHIENIITIVGSATYHIGKHVDDVKKHFFYPARA